MIEKYNKSKYLNLIIQNKIMSKTGGEAATDGEKKYVVKIFTSNLVD